MENKISYWSDDVKICESHPPPLASMTVHQALNGQGFFIMLRFMYMTHVCSTTFHDCDTDNRDVEKM